jgi:superfamily II DNA or RNA helicase
MSGLPEIEPQFSPGQPVWLRGSGRRGTVESWRVNGQQVEYDVFFGGDFAETYPERNLTAEVDDGTVLGRLRSWTLLDADGFRQALTTLKLRRPLEQNLYSYLASRTDLQPYQFKPVLKLLQSPYGRVFIADEVGLGKTIEAGIVMLELSARVGLRRVLVVCPPALTHKWRAEMRERFDLEFEIAGSARARELVADPDVMQAPVRAIASLNAMRSPPIVEALANGEARFDLVVIDESHTMQNPETASHRLGEQLSSAADHMLMLSATPLSLGTHNLYHQLSILAPDEFFDASDFDDRIEPNAYLNQAIRALRARPPDAVAAVNQLDRIRALQQGHIFAGHPLYEGVLNDLVDADLADDDSRFSLVRRINDLNTIGHVFTRTRKREVQDHFPARRAIVVKVTLTEPEQAFYDQVTEFVRQASGTYASFATIMPQRQVASSIPAAREYLRERWGGDVLVEDDTVAEIEIDVEDGDVAEELDIRASPSLADAWAAAADTKDSKYEQFVRTLADVIENGTARDGKVLVFSFFRKTLEHLARNLRSLEIGGRPLQVSLLYGPTPHEDRHAIMAAFREQPGPHVVLASEIAAEGLDFEFANVMVNYDLPWNPMRVEQRIGRLDRYGQQADVIYIVNFSVEGTIEERILDRLYTRIGIFEAAIGDLESILGNEIGQLTQELFQPGLTAEEEEALISQRAENIVARREENEQFEKESQALMGQDDVFAEQLARLERDKRYVGPEEVRNFVGTALRKRYTGLRLSESEGLATITLPKSCDVQELMRQYLLRHPEKDGRRAWQAVERARAGSEWELTFEPDIAKRRKDLDFVTLQHPLVGALLAVEPEVVRPTTSLEVIDARLPEGDVAFFVYLLNVHSFRRGLEFFPVAVSLSGEPRNDLADQLLSLIGIANTAPSLDPLPDLQLTRAWEAAESIAAAHVRGREEELELVSGQILDRRRSSLEESTERQLVKQRELLADARRNGYASIVRLREGTIRKLEAALPAKVAEIEALRGVEIGRELVAGGILSVRHG